MNDLFEFSETPFLSALEHSAGNLRSRGISSSARLPARVPIPIQSRLPHDRRDHEGERDREECGARRYVPAYVTREFRVSRTYTNASHIRAETGLHRLASAHIGITLSLT